MKIEDVIYIVYSRVVYTIPFFFKSENQITNKFKVQ